MFQWITCARRPLVVDELCEGIAFDIDDTRWDINKIPTDIVRLVRACSHLVVIDEETKVVQFAHYTVQQYILDGQEDRELFFQFTIQEAQEVLAETCVAYLHFSDFGTQVGLYVNTRITTGMTAIERVVSRTDLAVPKTASSEAMSLFNRLTHGRATRPTNIDYGRHITRKSESVDLILDRYRLLGYVRDNWLYHTASFLPNTEAKSQRDRMFHDLVLKKQLPFSFRPWNSNTHTKAKFPYLEPIGWALETNHCPLIRAISETDATFEPSGYFEGAGSWFFKDKVNTYISQDMLDRLQNCNQEMRHHNQTPGHAWLCSRILTACQRANLDVLRICMPETFSGSTDEANLGAPWVQIRGHLILEAAMNNQLSVITAILGVDSNSIIVVRSTTTFTMIYERAVYNALELAIILGHLESVQVLQGLGWKPTALLASGWQVGGIIGIKRPNDATWMKNSEVVATLLESLKVDPLDPRFQSLEDGKIDAFITALSGGHKSVVQTFRRYLDPLKPNGRGMCPFMQAISNGQSKMVEYFLDADLEIGAPGCGTQTNVEGFPLSLAASLGHLTIAEKLIEQGADTFSTMVNTGDGLCFSNNGTSEISATPLYAASANGHEAMVKCLLLHKANPGLLSSSGILTVRSSRPSVVLKCRRLFYADNPSENVNRVIALTDVASFQTPLSAAVVNGRINIVKILLESGLDVNGRDSNGDTALFLAAATGSRELMLILLQAGADKTNLAQGSRLSEQLLKCANSPARIVGLKCLLELGVYPDFVNTEGQSPLFNAVARGIPETVTALLEAGSEIERKDCKNNTPITIACKHGKANVFSILVGHGASLEVLNEKGQTLLHQVCHQGSLKMVELIAATSISINSMDNRGYTALMIASENGDAKVAEVLISRGADVNLKLPAGYKEESIVSNGIVLFPDGTTALMMAATKGWEKTVSLLTEAGAVVNDRDANGKTAVLAAALKGRSSVVQYLFNHGGSVTAKIKAGLGIITIAVGTRSLVLLRFLASLHEQVMRDEPPRLIFSSRDSGEALQFAVITTTLGIESLEFRQILRTIYYEAWGFQREHQAKYTALERQRIEAERQSGFPVCPADEEPFNKLIVTLRM